MMGGDHSHQKTSDQDPPPPAPGESPPPTLVQVQTPLTCQPSELPQCLMGNKSVDDMCFMITCTNWY